MTERQRKLGVTTSDIEQVKKGNIMADNGSFLAWMATVKKGQYLGRNVCKKMCKAISKHLPPNIETNEDLVFQEFKRKCKGLAASHPEQFYYTDTLGLDNLTIR